jgi:hypothetical protein
MIRPTTAQIEEANPVFFSNTWGEYGAINKSKIVRVSSGVFELRVETGHKTFPVYTIDETHALTYERHGW